MKINERYVNTGKKGYILLPRELIIQVINNYTGAMSEEEAYLTMLTLAYYKQVKIGSRVFQRGEILFSQRKWGKIVGWSQNRLRIFIQKLEDNQLIDVDRNKKPFTIALLRYEQLCAFRKDEPDRTKPVNQKDKQFEEFWQQYHELTQLPPHDIELARKTWGRLSLEERRMAIEHMEEYYMGLESVKHVRKAANYLKNKTFIL